MCAKDRIEAERLFAGRATHYLSGRPGYPEKLIDILKDNIGFERDSTVADIGSGTGKLSTLFLRNGNKVIGIEPNSEMRETSKRELDNFEKFSVLKGTAENTGLGTDSVDLVCAGQAFHWFDPIRTRKEFRRILRDGGMVCLVWNDRKLSGGNPVNMGYEEISTKYSVGYHKSGTGSIGDRKIMEFLGKRTLHFVLENIQRLDLQTFINRYKSASYSLTPGDGRFGEAIDELTDTFNRFQIEGKVQMEYETKMFIGNMGELT